jgi:hypothetical protein
MRRALEFEKRGQMSRNNYSRGHKCSGCGVPVTNHASKCCSCNTLAVGANYTGLPGRRRKYQEILAEIAAKPRDKAGRLIKNEYRLGLCCARCGGKRSDKSRRFCGPCYSRAEKPNFNEPDARMEFSPWQTLPDGTLMRTVTGI